ncbi:putative major capsid protein [Caudoviricetes sp.]|nr:putative major capsid protein [Caudoviricetes sp.]UOF79636.1 putative major capsid protein [Caudoviricetes sp.]UOF79823.1 putative major capsid protein [Bacteriophage sp.]UOF81307.1 putative major capsid protein [Caudoviricetes sp.]
MSDTINVAHVRQYGSNVIFLYQQKGAKLRGKVREKPIRARYDYFDRLAATAAVKKTVRHGDTPLINSQHSRRRAEMSDYEWADLVDPQDDIRTLIQPSSAYAMNGAMAVGRAFDDEAIVAFNADAREGEDGATVTTWASYTASNTDHAIAAGGVGLTVKKLRDAKEALDNDDVDDEGRNIAVSPSGVMDLLEDPQVTSSDFNTVQALVNGTVSGPYVGFNFIRTTRLSKSGNNRTCWVWQTNAMGMVVGMDLMTRISERSDKGYALQVYLMSSFGGVRVQDNGVVELVIDESV